MIFLCKKYKRCLKPLLLIVFRKTEFKRVLYLTAPFVVLISYKDANAEKLKSLSVVTAKRVGRPAHA